MTNFNTDVINLNLHAIIPNSRSNGPGQRFAVWFQGCTLSCPDCFNPETHSARPNQQISVDGLMVEIMRHLAQIEGISISGGEPFQQPEGLWELTRRIKQETELSVLIFSGYRIEEIYSIPYGPTILSFTDVLVAGRFVKTLRLGSGLLGSTNQKIHILSNRYQRADIRQTPPAEIIIDPAGNMIFSGIEPALSEWAQLGLGKLRSLKVNTVGMSCRKS